MSTTSAWLLVEDPGPWGDQIAVGGSTVPADVWAAARSRRVRINLVRERRWRRPRDLQRCFLISFGGDRRFVERWVRSDLYRRLSHAFDAVTVGEPAGGSALTEPIYLVCTNGERNAACGRHGRRLASALAGEVGARVWETTHVGGCHLAVNLVCLPLGVYYSGVTPQDVRSIVGATEEGRIALPRYRGRAGVPAHIQTAELGVRRATGIDSLNGVQPVAAEWVPSGASRVSIVTGAGAYQVMVRRRSDGGLGYEVAEMSLA